MLPKKLPNDSPTIYKNFNIVENLTSIFPEFFTEEEELCPPPSKVHILEEDEPIELHESSDSENEFRDPVNKNPTRQAEKKLTVYEELELYRSDAVGKITDPLDYWNHSQFPILKK